MQRIVVETTNARQLLVCRLSHNRLLIQESSGSVSKATSLQCCSFFGST